MSHPSKTLLPTRKSVPRFSRQSDHMNATLTIVKRRKLQWYGHVSRWLGLAKTMLPGTVKGGRTQGRDGKTTSESRCQIICGAPTTLTVEGQLMIMKEWKDSNTSFCNIIYCAHYLCNRHWKSTVREIFQRRSVSNTQKPLPAHIRW